MLSLSPASGNSWIGECNCLVLRVGLSLAPVTSLCYKLVRATPCNSPSLPWSQCLGKLLSVSKFKIESITTVARKTAWNLVLNLLRSVFIKQRIKFCKETLKLDLNRHRALLSYLKRLLNSLKMSVLLELVYKFIVSPKNSDRFYLILGEPIKNSCGRREWEEQVS